MERNRPGSRTALDFERLDRTAVRVFNSFEEADRYDREFWLSRTPIERMQALEHIRQQAWGYSNAEPQPEFPRLASVVERRGR